MERSARRSLALCVLVAGAIAYFSLRARHSASIPLLDVGVDALAPSDDAALTLADGPRGARDEGDARALVTQTAFGTPRITTKGLCAAIADGQDDHLVAPEDLRTSFVDGDDLLALVNRSPRGQLPPDWAPGDLVDLQSFAHVTAEDCDGRACLRIDAARALKELLEDMQAVGFPGKVESAFRSYSAQCWTFLDWEKKGSFCGAVEQSALPGHSQHQLGTAVDLFTEEWSDLAKDAGDERGVFRGGFGCTTGGKLLAARAPVFGFVLAYPIHPDDRHPDQSCVLRWDIVTGINPKTGYKNEAWHLRYLGKEAAQRFEAARVASGIGSPNELTLEQWLRSEKHVAGGDTELPVCDGCNCGACATLAEPGKNACDKKEGALHLDANGEPLALLTSEAPTILEAHLRKKKSGAILSLKLHVPRGILTQPPITGDEGASYAAGGTYASLAPYPGTAPRAFAPLLGAWTLGVETASDAREGGTDVAWPIRAALTDTVVGRIYDKANVLLPARAGTIVVRVALPNDTTAARVTLLHGGVAEGAEVTARVERAASPP